ncbi:hypothetical protein D3C81_1077960 [compost metagenome]
MPLEVVAVTGKVGLRGDVQATFKPAQHRRALVVLEVVAGAGMQPGEDVVEERVALGWVA